MDAPTSELDDKYRLDADRVYLTGTQALVRLPMMQRERDRAAGLNTAGFISGYRGSPLGNYDNALWRASAQLKAHDIVFSPGLNEDLAATAVWGSQQVGLFPGARVRGVFGVWYAKGPGVDRSADALKHANSAGTSQFGGVLALAGDDHGCDDARAQSRQPCGLFSIRPRRRRAIALFRLLDRLQGDLRNGGKLGDPARAHQYACVRHAR
jgi:hypothetical protein